MSERWKPAVTVAAVIERDGLFLLVEETTSSGLRLNQPAGHLEPQESLEQAVVREALEETGYEFLPTMLIGTYLTPNLAQKSQHGSYLRFAFGGQLGQRRTHELDAGIVRTLWMSRNELAACPERHRSGQVLACIDDYLAGKRAPLDLLHTHPDLDGAGDTSA